MNYQRSMHAVHLPIVEKIPAAIRNPGFPPSLEIVGTDERTPRFGEFHNEVTSLAVEIGNSLFPLAGGVMDVGGENKWCVTDQDIESERRFKTLVTSFGANHAIWAEEENAIYPARSEHIWVVDPISGTFSFMNDLPHYAVTVAHIYRGTLLYAAIYDPSTKELFSAHEGRGATLDWSHRDPGAHGKCIKECTVELGQRDRRFKPIIFDYMTSSWKHEETYLELFSELAKLGWVKSYGSLALHYAYVASGRASAAVSFNFDTYPEYAGKLILEEAGGRLTDFRGDPLMPGTRGVIASNGSELHAELIEILSRFNYEHL